MTGRVRVAAVLVRCPDGTVHEVAIPSGRMQDVIYAVSGVLPRGIEFFADPIREIRITPSRTGDDPSVEVIR